MARRDPDAYDFFVSYARVDNAGGFISAFIEGLQAAHMKSNDAAQFSYFFDQQEIRGLDDWQLRIYDGLARSRLMLAFVSPAYLTSEWCQREWRTWIDVEISKHILSQGVAAISILEVPGLLGPSDGTFVAREGARLNSINEPDPRLAEHLQRVPTVMKQLRRRQITSLTRFFPAGALALQGSELQGLVTDLARDLAQRTNDVRRAGGSYRHETLPPYNRRFSGRFDELMALRERLQDDRAGVVAGLHGLGGIGKTEIALAYAHAFAGAYPGGRFYINCEGQTSLRDAVLLLGESSEIRTRITDDERKIPDTHFAAIRRCLHERLSSLGSALIVLDNVDDPALLTTSETDRLTALGPTMHLLATTRLPPSSGARWQTVGELDEVAALELVERHRAFANDDEREAGRRLVHKLGGFPMAVELAAAYLAAHPEVDVGSFAATPRGLGRRGGRCRR